MRTPLATHKRRRGTALVEFTMLGIPAVFLFASIISASVDMWQFFTLSYAVGQTARYAALHGVTCTSAHSNSCTITRSDVATYFQGQALALSASSTTLVINDGSGDITCNPVTACPSSSSQFPATGYNSPSTNNITVKATYSLLNPIFMFWPSGGTTGAQSGGFAVSATSTQQILF